MMDYEMASFYTIQYILTFILFSIFQISVFKKSLWIKMSPLLLLMSILLISFPIFKLYLILFTAPTVESCLIITIVAILTELFIVMHNHKKGSKGWRNLLFIVFLLLFLYVSLRSFLWTKMFM